MLGVRGGLFGPLHVGGNASSRLFARLVDGFQSAVLGVADVCNGLRPSVLYLLHGGFSVGCGLRGPVCVRLDSIHKLLELVRGRRGGVVRAGTAAAHGIGDVRGIDQPAGNIPLKRDAAIGVGDHALRGLPRYRDHTAAVRDDNRHAARLEHGLDGQSLPAFAEYNIDLLIAIAPGCTKVQDGLTGGRATAGGCIIL